MGPSRPLKTALGATRQRLMTEVLTESLVLSLAGGGDFEMSVTFSGTIFTSIEEKGVEETTGSPTLA